MAALSWEEIVERGKQHNKTVLCEVEKRHGKRYFEIKCYICSDIKERNHHNFSSCTKCNGYTFIEKAKKIHGNKYNYDLVDYQKNDIKVKILCNRCNNVFLQTPNNHSNGNGCSICSYQLLADKQRLSLEEFIFKARSVHENKYNYDLVNYQKNYIKVKILCNICDEIFEQRPGCHLNGKGCPNCGQESRVFKRTMKINEFISKAKYLHNNKYNYDSSQYVNSRTNIKIYCNRCNLFFDQRPNHHLSGHGCPKCFESKGENRVAKYLLENNIIFTPQKTFKTLRDIRPLFPDFHLENLNLLIEYDGRGHYVACFGSTPQEKQKNLEDCQRRDKIKTEWAKANNIPLLRIPYWDYDRIEELIEAFILQHTKKKEIKQLVLEM